METQQNNRNDRHTFFFLIHFSLSKKQNKTFKHHLVLMFNTKTKMIPDQK
jgi:hypothetical protein